MELVTSDYEPLNRESGGFKKKWIAEFKKSSKIITATGYFSLESIRELAYLVTEYEKEFHLFLGMAKFNGITSTQRDAIIELVDKATVFNGSVKVATRWPFHGKVSVFYDAGFPQSALLGSSNISQLKSSPLYEVDVFLNQLEEVKEISKFSTGLFESAALFSDLEIKINNDINQLMAEVIADRKFKVLSREEHNAALSSCTEEEPIRIKMRGSETNPKSYLNAFFGKPRGGAGTPRPRPWYEAEFILSSNERAKLDSKGIKNLSFSVVTRAEGYSFKMKRSGDNLKNLRSSDSLEFLGSWIKANLESKNELHFQEKITSKILKNNNMSHVYLQPTSDSNLFIMYTG